MNKSEDALITQYAPLVRRQALRLISRLPASVELDDLIQAGMMGLLDALRRYQQTAEAQFETYAITRIRGAMLDELRSQDWLSRSVRSKARQIETAVGDLRQRLLREPLEHEVAAELDLPLDQYYQLLEEAVGTQVISYEDLNYQNNPGGDALNFLQDATAIADDDPITRLMSQELRQTLIQAIDLLPEREKLLFALQFQEDLNQKEIAAVMEITEGRVSQLRSQAIARIRSYMQSMQWDEVPDEIKGHPLL